MNDAEKTATQAIDYAAQTGDFSWAFHHIMDAAAREWFDRMLVETNDNLGMMPGTTEARFRLYINRVFA